MLLLILHMYVFYHCINITNVLVLVLIPEKSIAAGVGDRPKALPYWLIVILRKNSLIVY